MATKNVSPPSQSGSTMTTGHLLAERIQSLAKKQVNLQGQSGFFVTRQEMNKLEDEITRLLEDSNSTSLSPNALLELNDQLSAMSQRANKAESDLAAANIKINAHVVDIKSLENQVTKSQAATKIFVDQKEAERKKLVSELSALKVEKAKLQKSSDVEGATKIATQLRCVQNQLAIVNSEKEASKKEIKSLVSRLDLAKADLEAEQARSRRLATQTIQSKSFADVSKAPAPLDPFDMDDMLDGAVLNKVFSVEEQKKLEMAASARRDNIREYAHKLLELASSKDPRNFVGYKDYMKVIFDKVKSSKSAKRARFVPVLDAMVRSMYTRTGKTLNTIKQEMSDLIGADPVILKKKIDMSKLNSTNVSTPDAKLDENPEKPQYTWWEVIKLDFLRYRIKARSKLTGLFSKLRNLTLSRFKSVVAFFKTQD